MNNEPSSTCEDHLLEVLIEGSRASLESLEHASSCPDCRQELRHFQQRIDESRDFLAPSPLQIQRIRAKVRERLEPRKHRDFRWQPAWASVLVMCCFILLTIIAPRFLPPVVQVLPDGALISASADGLGDMVDQLLPVTAEVEPVWISALSGGISENGSVEHLDEMLDFVTPETGEQT